LKKAVDAAMEVKRPARRAAMGRSGVGMRLERSRRERVEREVEMVVKRERKNEKAMMVPREGPVARAAERKSVSSRSAGEQACYAPTAALVTSVGPNTIPCPPSSSSRSKYHHPTTPPTVACETPLKIAKLQR
jgi:hypothetical protein